MKHTYQSVVDILKVSQDRAARGDRYEAFERAVSFYARHSGLMFPEEGRGVLLIAGTNGKGAVAKTLETLLTSLSDMNVGLFTSPHLVEPTERIRSGGRDLSPAEMVRTYELIEDTVEKFHLSHFEILTLMMIEVFFGGRVRPIVNHAVIEVGVGGRLDPTRAVPHEIAVLAKIGLDHEAMLGSTLDLIAREKLAIIAGAKKLITFVPASETSAAFADARRENNTVSFTETPIFPSVVVASKDQAPRWVIQTPWGQAPLALLGQRAVETASLALTVLNSMGIDVASVLPRLAEVKWPGRMERVRAHGREVFLSGDHNEQGVASLVELLTHFRYQKIWLVIGIGKGKAIEPMLNQFRKIANSQLILTRTAFRPIESVTLESYRSSVAYMIDDALEALQFACGQAAPADLIVVSGSLYLVGDLKAALLNLESDPLN